MFALQSSVGSGGGELILGANPTRIWSVFGEVLIVYWPPQQLNDQANFVWRETHREALRSSSPNLSLPYSAAPSWEKRVERDTSTEVGRFLIKRDDPKFAFNSLPSSLASWHNLPPFVSFVCSSRQLQTTTISLNHCTQQISKLSTWALNIDFTFINHYCYIEGNICFAFYSVVSTRKKTNPQTFTSSGPSAGTP